MLDPECVSCSVWANQNNVNDLSEGGYGCIE